MNDIRRWCFTCIVVALCVVPARGVELEQFISREDPSFNVTNAQMSVGRDGKLYFSSGGYVLRMNRDGSDRKGDKVTGALMGIAANGQGVFATASAHFVHSVNVWRPDFTQVGSVTDFLVSDTVQWNAPSDVHVGASGTFYGIDQHRNRIVSVSATGIQGGSFPLAGLGEDLVTKTPRFRVWEPGKRFYVLTPAAMIAAIDFQGNKLWSIKSSLAGFGGNGGFDIDETGRVHVFEDSTKAVRVFSPDGQLERTLPLDPGGRKNPTTYFCLWGDEYFVRRADPVELVAVYASSNGEFRRLIDANVDVVKLKAAGEIWTAGEAAPIDISFKSSQGHQAPHWRAWLRPLGTVQFVELPLLNGATQVPADAGGLYQLRISPDIQGLPVEYTLDTCVEIRRPDALGSLSLFTPHNRFYYGCGEKIPVTVLLRGGDNAGAPREFDLRLTSGTKTFATQHVSLEAEKPGQWEIPADVTDKLSPGNYIVTTDAPTLTVAPQYFEIGSGLRKRPKFHLVQHGDYVMGFPNGTWNSMPDEVAGHLDSTRRLGTNLFVDRLGTHGMFWTAVQSPPGVQERLASDPRAVAPQKAVMEDPIRRCVAAYGAYGIEEQAILLYMDAGLPVGTGFDPRPPEKLAETIENLAKALLDYPAMRGWSWAANWWLGKPGIEASNTPEERASYEAAMRAVKETGKWSPILETVTDRSMALPGDGERQFRAALEKVAPGKLSVMTGPYRAIQMHPPVMFKNADEVDLHFQAEQIQPPQSAPHNVDFYKRPGKPAWGHPELWNDDGTGGMILPTALQMVMRGATGIGHSGPVGVMGSFTENARSAGFGTRSIVRSLNTLLQCYGEWLTTLQNADRVAIVVSTRMQRIEVWDGKVGGHYFDSLFEAYNACLYAHRPASFVFVEDLKSDTFDRFQAILVISQQVELDPPLATALSAAQGNGKKIFYDKSCRAECVAGFMPLDIAFNRVSADPSAWQDDSAYDRFPRYFREEAAALTKVLSPIVPAVAETGSADVMLSELKSGDQRFIWAVNNTIPRWEPGLAWRTGVLISQRLPVTAILDIACEDHVVYDVFADAILPPGQASVAGSKRFAVDLQAWPARLLAVLPRATADASIASLRALRSKHERPESVDQLFGMHAKQIAVSDDNQTALINTFNDQSNLVAIDIASGKPVWTHKIGDRFAFEPVAFKGGFAALGFDVHTAEGYHLYYFDNAGHALRRFALYGLPKRALTWFGADSITDPLIASFAVSPDGAWVAAGGDLGVAVWTKDGKPLWSDDSWKINRDRRALLALDASTLVTLRGMTVAAFRASDGQELWKLALGNSGTVLGGAIAPDHNTLAVRTDAAGGKLFIVRDGKLLNSFVGPAESIAFTPDAKHFAVTTQRQLKWYAKNGFEWTFTSDTALRNPRISHDGSKISVCNELGVLSILDIQGKLLVQRDLGAVATSTWLADGGLMTATWQGQVERLNSALATTWKSSLPQTPTLTAAGLADLPTTRKTDWGNAAAEPASLEHNLLRDTKALMYAFSEPHGRTVPWVQPIETLTDGKPDAPDEPRLEWTQINMIDSGWQGPTVFVVDLFRTQGRVEGITFVEDPKHPESWLRDLRIQWWDSEAEVWQDGPQLLSNSAIHTHWFEKPLEAPKFRFISTGGIGWPAGNLRLGELVFHGEALGASHRDAVAKRPLAVLIDEREKDVADLFPADRARFGFRYSDAFSGGKCLVLFQPGNAGANYYLPFGHSVPQWDFEIVEQPTAGQYRWLQFAWKANSPKTNGMRLMIGNSFPGPSYGFTTGKLAVDGQGVVSHRQIADTAPTEWQTVRVDLWKMYHTQPFNIRCIMFSSEGDGAAFDQIVLGRTEADLPPQKQ